MRKTPLCHGLPVPKKFRKQVNKKLGRKGRPSRQLSVAKSTDEATENVRVSPKTVKKLIHRLTKVKVPVSPKTVNPRLKKAKVPVSPKTVANPASKLTKVSRPVLSLKKVSKPLRKVSRPVLKFEKVSSSLQEVSEPAIAFGIVRELVKTVCAPSEPECLDQINHTLEQIFEPNVTLETAPVPILRKLSEHYDLLLEKIAEAHGPQLFEQPSEIILVSADSETEKSQGIEINISCNWLLSGLTLLVLALANPAFAGAMAPVVHVPSGAFHF